MNSPSYALVWELWRKNRGGFAALLVVLAVCAALSLQVQRLQQRAARLAAHDPNRVVFSLDQILASPNSVALSPSGLVAQTIQLKLQKEILYEGPGNATDSLLVEANFSKGPELRVILRGSGNSYAERSGLAATATNSGAASSEANRVAAQAAGGSISYRSNSLEQVIYEGPLRRRGELSWSTSDGRTGSLTPVFDPGYLEQVGLVTATAEHWREMALVWCVLLLSFAGLIILGIFGSAEPHAGRGFTGIPPRRFTLPVSTVTLVGWLIGLGWITMALTYLAWSRFVSVALLPAGTKLPDLYFTVLLSAGLIAFQATVWGLPSFPKTRVCLITVLVLGLLALAALPSVARTSAGTALRDWKSLQTLCVAVFAVACAGGIGAACLGVRLERRGAWSSRTQSSVLVKSPGCRLPRPITFGSAQHAQFWMEWRRNGRTALAIWVALICVVFGFDLTTRIAFPEWQWIAGDALDIGAIAGIVWAGITGLNLARDGASRALALSSFTAVRPVTSGALLEAKLLLGATLWIGAAAMTAAGWFTSAMTTGGQGRFGETGFPAIILLAISLHVFIGILPLCLSGRMPGFPWSLLPLVIVYGAVLNGLFWFAWNADRSGHTEQYSALLFGLLMVLLVVKLAVAFWAFRRGLGLRISSAGFVARYVVLWLAGAGLLVWLAWASVALAGWPTIMLPFIPAAALVLPLARIALSPLALAMNRHR